MTRLAKKISVIVLTLAFACMAVVGLTSVTSKAHASSLNAAAQAVQDALDLEKQYIYEFDSAEDVVLDFEGATVTQKVANSPAIYIKTSNNSTATLTLKNLTVEYLSGAIHVSGVNVVLENITVTDVNKDTKTETYAIGAENSTTKFLDFLLLQKMLFNFTKKFFLCVFVVFLYEYFCYLFNKKIIIHQNCYFLAFFMCFLPFLRFFADLLKINKTTIYCGVTIFFYKI